MSLNVCQKTKSGNILTCEGRMMHPHFFSPSMPKGETDKEKARYQGTLIFAANADLTILAEAVEAAAVEKWGADYKKKHKVKKPFLKSEDQPKMGDIAGDFPVFIRCNSKEKPQIVDASLNNVDDSKSDQVYPGRWARFSVRPYAYDHPTGGKGVSLGLQNVQLLRDDERLAGGRAQAEDDFEPVGDAGGAPKGASTAALFE